MQQRGRVQQPQADRPIVVEDFSRHAVLVHIEVEIPARTRGVRRCAGLCGRATGVRWLCELAVCVAQPFGSVCLAKRSPGQKHAALSAPINSTNQ